MNFTNISANTLHRSIEKMNAGGQFTEGANFLTRTKWDNLKTFLSSLLSSIGIMKNRQDKVCEKIDVLESISTNFAVDILKANICHENSTCPEYLDISLRSGDSDHHSDDPTHERIGFTLTQTPKGNLLIQDPNNMEVVASIKFADLQVLALKELLDKATAAGTDARININAIPKFGNIRDKFIERFGTAAVHNLDARCARFPSENVLVKDPGPAKTTQEIEADRVWARAGDAVAKERIASRISTPFAAE